MLGASESAIAFGTANAGGCSREEDRALAARCHVARCFTSGEETREAGHFPDLVVLLRSCLTYVELYVRANVEHDDGQRSDFVLDALKERHDLFFLSRIAATCVHLSAVSA